MTRGAMLGALLAVLASCVPQTPPPLQPAAQTPPRGRAFCDSAARAGSRDSVAVALGTIVRPFDPRDALPGNYRRLIAIGIRQYITLPLPLVLSTYQSRGLDSVWDRLPRSFHVDRASIGKLTDSLVRLGDAPVTATPVLRAAFGVRLLRDGHLRDLHVMGGVRNRAFDAAVVAALTTVDTLGLLPPLPDSVRIPRDGLDLRILIASHNEWSSRDSLAAKPSASDTVEPLAYFKEPAFPSARVIAPLPNEPAPHYPDEARRSGVEGQVLAEFVVDADGRIDPETISFVQASSMPFVRAVAEVLPKLRFRPMELVAGCPVRELVQMPFVFSLGY